MEMKVGLKVGKSARCIGLETKMENDDLDPLLVAPPSYLEVRNKLRDAVGFPNERRPLLIGIDGLDGSGKSALAT